MSGRFVRIESPADAFGWRFAVIIALALFVLATAPGLILDGRTPDDWRQVHGAPVGGMPMNWTTEEGRWLMEVIFVHVLGERFLPELQAVLAAVTLFVISVLIARAAIDDPLRPPATVLLFALGVHHLYMVNALTFSSHVFAYPFALLLSLSAFHMFRMATDLRAIKAVLLMALGAQVLAFSAAIYQPFAPFGSVLLFIAMLRFDRIAIRTLIRFVIVATIGTVLGGLLYAVEAQIAASLHPHEPLTERVTVTGVAALLAKLAEAPVQVLRVWTGTLQFIPLWLKLMNAGGFGLTSLLLLALAIRALRTRGPAAGLRVLLGAAGITAVLPLFVWLANDSGHFPSRIVAYAGFVLAGVYVTAADFFLDRRRLRPVLLFAPAAFAAVHVVVAALAWWDQTETGRRDEALAGEIFSRVNETPGYDGRPFRIVGGTAYDDLTWGDFIGWTSFHPGTPQIGIFKAMFDTGWFADTGLFEAPLACPAFPAPGSVYLHEGVVYVCLSDAAGFEDASQCSVSVNAAIGRVCVMHRAIVRFRDACDLAPNASRIELADIADPSSVATFFNVEATGHETEDGCIYTTRWEKPLPDALDVTVVEPDGSVSWSERLTLAR